MRKAIEYIKTFTNNNEGEIKFWLYFEKTWLTWFPPNVWNTSDISDLDLKNRTNNALERYHRRLNQFVVNAHPNICAFAEIIKDEFTFYEEKCAEIRQNGGSATFSQNTFPQDTVAQKYISQKNSERRSSANTLPQYTVLQNMFLQDTIPQDTFLQAYFRILIFSKSVLPNLHV
ncbi:hypothetical protein RF11_09826 [Thelohanellus kitauei]|uniref:Uncharacterized protein n=1 Tax=Thelohanellus kitauei TaxID=669202 RepID=A0A0C2JUZ8_THEKT|nr:hypothetical protein RF11_09826 [Thelohanellus kitauei]